MHQSKMLGCPAFYYSFCCNYSANKTLLAQNLYITLFFATHRKAILQSWLLLVNFLNYSFSLALLLLELLASDNCISLIIAFRTSAFQGKNKKGSVYLYCSHLDAHVTLQYAVVKCMTLSAQTYILCMS